MDLKEINIPEPIRSWYLSGIRYVFSSLSQPEADSRFDQEGPEYQANKFPEPWQGLWQQITIPQISVWTYWELGEDLSSYFSEMRWKLFRNILSSLKWNQDKVTFWPINKIDQGYIQIHNDIFWQGLDLIKPEYLICFGQAAFACLFPDRNKKDTIFQVQGIQVIVLPGPEEMLPDNREAKKIVWETLKNLPVGSPIKS